MAPARRGPPDDRGGFRRRIANASDVVSIVAKDGTVALASQPVARIQGHVPAEGEGRNLVEFVHPDDREHAAGTLGSAVPSPIVINDAQRRVGDGGGQYRVPESGAQAVVAADGGLEFVVSSCAATERVAAEGALRSSEARCRTLFDDDSGMYFELEQDGTNRSVNRSGAGLLAYGEAALAGPPALAMHAVRERWCFRRQLAATIAGPAALGRWDPCLDRRDGSPWWGR